MKKKTNLGAVIKEARESLGLTQRGLAAKVGVKASHIAYIEGNRRRPSLPLVRNLAVVLGLDRREMLFLSYPDAQVEVRFHAPVACRCRSAALTRWIAGHEWSIRFGAQLSRNPFRLV